MATTTSTGTRTAYESSLVLSGNTFVTFIGTSFKAYKAYFPYSNNETKSFSIILDDDNATTAVSSIEKSKAVYSIAYNSLGIKVSPNAKGLVIINGKKIYNK